jgi:predicted nucleotidyltransferase
MMDLSGEYGYWLNHANYDMETAEAMLSLASQYADDVRQKLPVSRAILFSSYERGTASELSDREIFKTGRDI